MDEDMLSGKPRTQLSMLMKNKWKTNRTRESYYDEPPQADHSWLYPIILPSIFPTLFSLYQEHYSRDDHKIEHVMAELDHYGDEELSGILEVKNTFEEWKRQESVSSQCSLSDSVFRFSNYLQGAIKIFQTISGYFTPSNKLLCVQDVINELKPMLVFEKEERAESIHSPYEKRELADGDGEGSREEAACCLIGDEEDRDGVPTGVLTLVIIRSRVSNLYSEIHFTQDFAGNTLLQDQYGFLLSKLKDSFLQLQELNL